jgi:hypothetical protein
MCSSQIKYHSSFFIKFDTLAFQFKFDTPLYCDRSEIAVCKLASCCRDTRPRKEELILHGGSVYIWEPKHHNVTCCTFHKTLKNSNVQTVVFLLILWILNYFVVQIQNEEDFNFLTKAYFATLIVLLLVLIIVYSSSQFLELGCGQTIF